MGNTQAKLAPTLEDAERGTRGNTLKRAAIPDPLDAPNKRRGHAIEFSDTGHLNEIMPHLSERSKPHETLRNSLDRDEQFLELPHLFDLVGAVAKRMSVDDKFLHKNYRGQDAPSCLPNKKGRWTRPVSKARSFRPVTAVARTDYIGRNNNRKQELLVWGRENETTPQWLAVSYHLDTQLPHLILRVSTPSTADAQFKREDVFVNIFATNLVRGSTKSTPITMLTGKNITIARKETELLASTRPPSWKR